MAYEVILPKIDEAMTEGKIIEWIKKEGDRVEKGMVLFALETEKVNWEVESPAAGTLSKHLAEAGDKIAVGVIVAYVLNEGEVMPQDHPKTAGVGEVKENTVVASASDGLEKKPSKIAKISTRIRVTPLARKIAKELSVDLCKVSGSGPGGRIKKEDVENYVDRHSQIQKCPNASNDVVALSSMRETIARRMTESFQLIPHFFLTVELDVSNLRKFRNSILATIQKRTGNRITYTDIFIKIVARAIEDNPQINTSWADAAISVRHTIDIGVAVNIDNGLVVPVLKEANQKNMEEIAEIRAELVERARKGKLLPADMNGGSLTITNLGMYGIDQFNPIINPPESCILGIGRMVEKPVVRDGSVVIRPMMNLTLSIDHRVLDGGSGSQFLQRISELIENPLLML